MKVLQVNKLYHPHIGGIENHIRILATGMRGKADVRVLVANEKFESVTENVDDLQVTRVASLGRFRSVPVAPGFIIQLAKAKSDIYHLHFPNPLGEISFLLAKPHDKLVVTYHSDIVRQKVALKFYRSFIERFLSRADRIIVGSPNLIENSPFLQKVQDKCRVIPFGIRSDWLQLTPEVKEKVEDIRRKRGPNIAFFLGRLIYYKGVDYLVRAMRNVEGALIIAGEGDLGPELKKLAEDIGVADKVEFAGTLSNEDLAAYYYACDVFVLPSIEPSEAYGLVQLEAHACGKPVISTNLPTGVPYVNQDGVTGLIVPPRDEGSLSKAMHKLFNDDALRAKLGAQAKERFEREFTSEIMVNRTLDVYGEIY